jgi:hypothetical protein
MRKKSNKFPICESCGQDEHGGRDPDWKPPAVSLKTLKAQLKEAGRACQMEQAALLTEQHNHRKTDETWAAVHKEEIERWQGRVEKLKAEHTEVTANMMRDIAYFKERNGELTRMLDYEERRAAQALEVADNAAAGMACIARVTNRLLKRGAS